METKVCKSCSIEKPVSEFYGHRYTADRLRPKCKKCMSHRPYGYDERTEMQLQGMKYCPKCKTWKGKTDFYKNKSQGDGLTGMCKICLLKDQREYRERNRDAILERERVSKATFYKTPEGKANRARARHKRKTRERDSIATLTNQEWQAILSVQDNVCLRCKEPFTEQNPANRDHIVPVSLGGDLVLDNVQALHRSCNTSKGAKMVDYRPDDWFDKLSVLL